MSERRHVRFKAYLRYVGPFRNRSSRHGIEKTNGRLDVQSSSYRTDNIGYELSVLYWTATPNSAKAPDNFQSIPTPTWRASMESWRRSSMNNRKNSPETEGRALFAMNNCGRTRSLFWSPKDITNLHWGLARTFHQSTSRVPYEMHIGPGTVYTCSLMEGVCCDRASPSRRLNWVVFVIPGTFGSSISSMYRSLHSSACSSCMVSRFELGTVDSR